MALARKTQEVQRVARVEAEQAAREEAARQARAAQQRLEEEAERQRARLERVLAQLNVQMVQVQGGTFTMGCQAGFFSDNCQTDEKPAHRVEIRSFELSKYEVTHGLWEAVMGKSPSKFKNCPQCPVEQVSWDDVQKFLQKLNAGGERYRLPSEAEWEYAARGGQRSRGYEYAGSNSPNTVAWYKENSGGKIHRVGQKQTNELGLYDLSGNVWEWVADCWNDSYRGAPTDGKAWTSGDCSRRVQRGGSYYGGPSLLRSADRYGFTTGIQNSGNGFRIARSLP